MNILIERDKELTSEWVLTSRLKPTEMSDKLSSLNFHKGITGYSKPYSQNMFKFSWNRNDPSGNGLFLYYARYNGEPNEGMEIISGLHRILKLNKRSVAIFVPANPSTIAKRISQNGFVEKSVSTSDQARCYNIQGISLILFEDGYILQTRATLQWQWIHAQKKLIQIYNDLKNDTIGEEAV